MISRQTSIPDHSGTSTVVPEKSDNNKERLRGRLLKTDCETFLLPHFIYEDNSRELLHCIDGSLAVSGSVHANGIYAEGGTSRMAATAGIVAIGDDLIPRLGNNSFILLLHLRHTGAVRIMELMCIGIQNIGLFCRRIRCCGLAGT